MDINNSSPQITGTLSTSLSDAVLNGYVQNLEINNDWISYKNPKYPYNSASLQEGRMNRSGQAAFYLASGDYCGQAEVTGFASRVRCNIAPQTINVFNLQQFASDYNYEDAFVQQQASGGWAVCQEVSDYLTSNHSISGVLYQSAALHQQGVSGYCMAIIPERGASLSPDFFVDVNDFV